MAVTIVDTSRPVTSGVDTHLDLNVAAALDGIGGLLGVEQFPTTPAGKPGATGAAERLRCHRSGRVEGTGVWGAVCPPSAPGRCGGGRGGPPQPPGATPQSKTDTVDAIEAARPHRAAPARVGPDPRRQCGSHPGVGGSETLGQVDQDSRPSTRSAIWLHRPRRDPPALAGYRTVNDILNARQAHLYRTPGERRTTGRQVCYLGRFPPRLCSIGWHRRVGASVTAGGSRCGHTGLRLGLRVHRVAAQLGSAGSQSSASTGESRPSDRAAGMNPAARNRRHERFQRLVACRLPALWRAPPRSRDSCHPDYRLHFLMPTYFDIVI